MKYRSVLIIVRRICVYCGSSSGLRPVYAEAARTLGRLLAAQGIELVYGGACRGLMGYLADAVLEGVVEQSA
jgi:predicted Rossmann-fold nucleotide-binding protein